MKNDTNLHGKRERKKNDGLLKIFSGKAIRINLKKTTKSKLIHLNISTTEMSLNYSQNSAFYLLPSFAGLIYLKPIEFLQTKGRKE